MERQIPVGEVGFFDLIFKNSLCGLLLADYDTKDICLVNEKTCEILGYSEEELKKLKITEIHSHENILEENIVEKVSMKRKDGHLIHMDVCSIPIEFNGRKYLLEAFICLENQVAKNIVTAIDTKGNIIFINRDGCKILGYKKEDIIGKNWFDEFLPENIRKRIKEIFRELMKEKSSKYVEYPVLTKNGEKRLRWRNVILKNNRGKLKGVFGIGEDISHEKMEENLRKSEEMYRLMVENLEEYAIYMIDKNGIIISWNKGAEKIKGYKEREIVGKHFSCFFNEEDNKNNVPEKILKIAKRKGKYKGEGWRVCKDGKLFWAQAFINAIKDKNGNLQGFVVITKDLTERRKMEEEIIDAYRQVKRALEDEKKFKRDTAHYFFNPIAIAKGYLSLALEEIDEDKKKNIEKAIIAIDRVEKVVKNITERGKIIE